MNGSISDADMTALEKNIHEADAFILMYSVTDKCSFDDCNRLRFLINYNNKRRRRSIISTVNAASKFTCLILYFQKCKNCI